MPMISRIYPLSMLTKKSPKHGTRKLITMPMISRIYPLSMRTKKSPKHGTNKKALLTSPCCVDEYDHTAKTEPSDFTEKSLSSDISSFQCAVRFSSSVEVRPILSSKHYTPEVRKACWYQNEEYREIRYECVKELKKIQRGECLEDENYSSRGLKTQTNVGRTLKSINRRDAFDAVLSEQQKQVRLGVVDEQAIAQKYQQIASSCQMWAHTIGLRDQLEANKFLRKIPVKPAPKTFGLNVMAPVAKRPLNLFRNSSIYSQNSTKTEATEVEKYLSFDDNVRVCYTIARSDFSLEETTATWYTTEEYMRISEQCSRQIYKMDEGKVLKGRKYCSRGLETRRGRAIKIQNRSSSIETVLMEQEKQSDEGTYDGVVISRVYRGVTSSCQLWANIVGVRDQRVAEDYLDDINLQMPQTITKEPEQQSKPSILRRKPRQPSILRSKPRPRRNEVAARIA